MSASEVVLQLLCGSHRLTPMDTHQRQTVVVLFGPHTQRAYGVNTAHQLTTHNVNVAVFVPNLTKIRTGGKTAASVKDHHHNILCVCH